MENNISTNSEHTSIEKAELELELRRVMFELTNLPISVKFEKKFSGFDFGGIKIPPAIENSRLELPYFIASILLQEGFIEDYRDSFPLSLQELTTAVRKEVRQGEVQSIHPYLYSLFSKQLIDDTINNSQFDEIELKRQKAKINQLIAERLAKIIKFADVADFNPEKLNLTASEAILMKKINTWITSWKSTIINRNIEG